MFTRTKVLSLMIATLLILTLVPDASTAALSEPLNTLSDAETAAVVPPTLAEEARKQQARESYANLPLYFIENQGQRDERVAYYIQQGGTNVYFTAEEMVMALPESVLRQRFVDANPGVRITGSRKQEAKFNYFIGDDPDGWHNSIDSYGKITYRDLYPGVDLTYTGRNGALKYEFVLQPGADVDDIRLAYAGVDDLRLADNGDMLITPQGADTPLRDAAPTVYQEIKGQRVPVEANFTLYDDKTYSFALDDYNRDYPLVVDPQLCYSTFLGGSGNEWSKAIAIDSEGNIYVTGGTGSSSFPTTSGAYDTNHNDGDADVFVSVLDPTLRTLRYSTFLGGSGGDDAAGVSEGSDAIALDNTGNVYIMGDTNSDDFPTTPGAYDVIRDDWDVFVSVLDPTLSSLRYSTFLGGSDYDWGDALALDVEGNVYVTGETGSDDFPITAGAYDETYEDDDIFVSVLDPTLSTLSYSTFLGGGDSDWGRAIALDGMGNVYVTGSTESEGFPTTPGAYDTSHSGSDDVFVSVLNPTLSALRHSTLLGETDRDYGYDIALDGSGNVYVTGQTQSDGFPTTKEAYDTSYNEYGDVFVSVLDPTLNDLRYSTFLGGSNYEWGWALTLDNAGDVYVAGETGSEGFPTTAGADDVSQNGGNDVFASVLDPTLSTLRYSTFLGGNDRDEAQAIALNDAGSAYLTGDTNSDNFPTTSGTYDTSQNGGNDAFVSMLDIGGGVISSISGQVQDSSSNPIFGVTISAGAGGSATTNATGTYAITDLSVGTYILTPTKPGWVFVPPTRTVTVPPDATGQDFTMFHPPVSTTLTLSGTTNLSSTLCYTDTQGLTTTLTFPRGAVTETTAIVLTPTIASGGALAFAGHAFDLEAYQGDELQPGFAFRENKPVTVTIHYSEQDVHLISDDSKLTLRWWNGNSWRDAAETCGPASDYARDQEKRVISVSICHLSRFALLGPTKRVYLPIVLRNR